MVDSSKIERAQAIAQSGIVELVKGAAVSVLDKSVRAYYDRKLTDRDAAVAIATIAELRALAGKLENQLIRGTIEGEKLTESPNA